MGLNIRDGDVVPKGFGAREENSSAPDEFEAAFGGERSVLRRSEDVPDEVAKLVVGDLFEALGHEREVADGTGFDVVFGDDDFVGADVDEGDAGVGFIDEAAVEGAAVVGIDGDVFVALPDDLVGIDDVDQERVEGGAAHAGEIGANSGALAVEFMTDQTEGGGQLATALEVGLASECGLAFFGDDTELVGIGIAYAAEDGLGAAGEPAGVGMGLDHGADGGGGDIMGGDEFMLESIEERRDPAGSSDEDVGYFASKGGREVVPAFEQRVWHTVTAQFAKGPDAGDGQCRGWRLVQEIEQGVAGGFGGVTAD
jgi:hypothetical protein